MTDAVAGEVIDEVICAAPTGDVCGEGAVWHAAEGAVYWVDINRFLIHRFLVADGSVRSWIFEEAVTSLSLTDRDDVLAVVLGSGVILWEPATDRRSDFIFKLDGWPKVRLNDARSDPRGSLWMGSMRNNVNADGSAGEAGGADGELMRLDTNGKVSVWREGIGISNTLAWSPDRRSFYFGDTIANVIWAYGYDFASGAISGERPFLQGFFARVARWFDDRCGRIFVELPVLWKLYRASGSGRQNRTGGGNAGEKYYDLLLWRRGAADFVCDDCFGAGATE